MSSFKSNAEATANIAPRPASARPEKSVDTKPKVGTVAIQEQTSRMHAAEERAEELEARLKNSRSAEVQITDLTEVPGRRRQLTMQEFVELRDNLASHPLITPITVRKAEHGYEIVSGHNRVAAYRDLGRTAIEAWITDAPEGAAEELAFYANLLHPSLPDYEKYLGLQKVVAANGGPMTDAEISARTGMSETIVWQLGQFAGLPEKAKAILAMRPEKFGSKVAAKLAVLTAAGNGDRVVSAIKALVEEDIDQKDALAMAVAAENKPSAQKKSTRIRLGNQTFCTIQSAAKTMRITFANADDRAEVETLVQELLQHQSDRKKKQS